MLFTTTLALYQMGVFALLIEVICCTSWWWCVQCCCKDAARHAFEQQAVLLVLQPLIDKLMPLDYVIHVHSLVITAYNFSLRY
jgi:hypothetical protein